MKVTLNRPQPVTPPIESVTFTLSVEDTEKLYQILNRRSPIDHSGAKHSKDAVEEFSSKMWGQLHGAGFNHNGLRV